LPDGAPWPDVPTAVGEIVEAIEGRPPTADEAQRLTRMLQDQTVAEALADVVAANNSAAMIDRLYLIFFGRTPDAKGYDYWIDHRGDGQSLEEIAEWFASSSEFKRRYGGGTFEDFLDRLYSDVLNRPPDSKGNAYWLDLLDRGEVTRGTIVVYFSEGQEAVGLSKLRTERAVLSRILTGQRPSDADLEHWENLRVDHDLASAIEAILG
jgi:hypothetical protein